MVSETFESGRESTYGVWEGDLLESANLGVENVALVGHSCRGIHSLAVWRF